MSSRLKVAVVGATGETGASIVNALLESPEKFVCYSTFQICQINLGGAKLI